MHIHYLTPSRIPSRRANGVHVMKMAAAMTRQGHDVTLFASFGDEAGADIWSWYGVAPSFRLVRCPRPRPRNWGRLVYGFSTLAQSLRQGLPDLYLARSAPAMLFCAFAGRPFIYETHTLPGGTLGRAVERWLSRRRNFLGMVAVSEALKQDLLAANPHIPAGRILVAHDAADPAPAPRPATRAPGPFRIGYAGHLYPGKGMEIIAQVASILPQFEFHVAGGMADDIARWKPCCSPNIRFHGHVSQGALAAIYASFDAAMIPLQTKVQTYDRKADIARWTSPLKLFEYMAHGLPIVASDVPVLREVLSHGETALIMPPSDIQAWAGALNRLANDQALREKLGQNARTAFQSRHTWDKRAAAILSRFSPC